MKTTFGMDEDKPMDRTERLHDSWRRSSRKYRAKKARERAQATLFDEEVLADGSSPGMASRDADPVVRVRTDLQP